MRICLGQGISWAVEKQLTEKPCYACDDNVLERKLFLRVGKKTPTQGFSKNRETA